MESNTLLTDKNIVSLTIWIISLLGLGLISCIVWIFNKVMSEIKSYRTESLVQRGEFNDALNNKFKAMNFYMKQTDKVQILHEERINGFHDHARDIKEKLISHAERLESHGKQLSVHEIEIKNLKKIG